MGRIKRPSRVGIQARRVLNRVPDNLALRDLRAYLADLPDADFDSGVLDITISVVAESCRDGTTMSVPEFQDLLVLIRDRYRKIITDLSDSR